MSGRAASSASAIAPETSACTSRVTTPLRESSSAE